MSEAPVDNFLPMLQCLGVLMLLGLGVVFFALSRKKSPTKKPQETYQADETAW